MNEENEAEGGYAAVDWKAQRQCVYCSKRQATPDSLSCVECMRGIPWPNPADLAHLQNAWSGAAPPLRPGESISVRYIKVPWWRRAWNWLRRAT